MGPVLQGLDQFLGLGGALSWFTAQAGHVVALVLAAYLFQTVNPFMPNQPFTSVSAISRLAPLARAAADSALTAVAMWSAYRLMWDRSSYRLHYTAQVVVPRVVLGTLMINFAVPLVQGAVDFSNALSRAVVLATGSQIRADATAFLRFADPLWGLDGVTALVLFGAYLVLALAYVIRFSLLVVLTVLAPVAALLFVLPETDHYARRWVSLFVSALLMQPLQLLILAVGFGLDGTPSPLPVRHVYALASIFIAFKVPGALHSTSFFGTRATSFVRRQVRRAWRLALK
jgi:hypothetical protein